MIGLSDKPATLKRELKDGAPAGASKRNESFQIVKLREVSHASATVPSEDARDMNGIEIVSKLHKLQRPWIRNQSTASRA